MPVNYRTVRSRSSSAVRTPRTRALIISRWWRPRLHTIPLPRMAGVSTRNRAPIFVALARGANAITSASVVVENGPTVDRYRAYRWPVHRCPGRRTDRIRVSRIKRGLVGTAGTRGAVNDRDQKEVGVNGKLNVIRRVNRFRFVILN